jgi:hypothetical protein
MLAPRAPIWAYAIALVNFSTSSSLRPARVKIARAWGCILCFSSSLGATIAGLFRAAATSSRIAAAYFFSTGSVRRETRKTAGRRK